MLECDFLCVYVYMYISAKMHACMGGWVGGRGWGDMPNWQEHVLGLLRRKIVFDSDHETYEAKGVLFLNLILRA